MRLPASNYHIWCLARPPALPVEVGLEHEDEVHQVDARAHREELERRLLGRALAQQRGEHVDRRDVDEAAGGEALEQRRVGAAGGEAVPGSESILCRL